MINNVKPRNVVPKPEALKEHQTYAFTINPEVQHFGDSERLSKVIRHLKNILNSEYIAYRLYIEVSSHGRVYAHGHIRVCKAREFYLHTIPHFEKLATIVMEEITDDEGWNEYCQKQIPLMCVKVISKDYPPQYKEITTDIHKYYP